MENKLLFLIIVILGLWFIFSSNGQSVIKKAVGAVTGSTAAGNSASNQLNNAINGKLPDGSQPSQGGTYSGGSNGANA